MLYFSVQWQLAMFINKHSDLQDITMYISIALVELVYSVYCLCVL